MEIQIESPQFPLTAALDRYLKRRLDQDLSFCAQSVRGVRAYLSDVNGRRGGIDKHCRLVVRLNRDAEVVVRSTETDLYVAIRRAADRLRQAVERRVGRRRLMTRRPRAKKIALEPSPAFGDA